ncbi:MAG: peptide chain release factor 2, partial [Bacteroidaceae bacterium]|nr:peptide chain release factor 2 [Bacteroidaceae bacterium]
MITAEQLKELNDRVEKLCRYLNIDDRRMQLQEEEIRTQAPDFWDDPKAAEAQMKKVKDLQK